MPIEGGQPAMETNGKERADSLREPQCDRDGPLSLSLSSSERERVPKAAEGVVDNADKRQELMQASTSHSLRPSGQKPESRQRSGPQFGSLTLCTGGRDRLVNACDLLLGLGFDGAGEIIDERR
jgi:hypothetical protein